MDSRNKRNGEDSFVGIFGKELEMESLVCLYVHVRVHVLYMYIHTEEI